MSGVLVVITDGRADYLAESIESIEQNVTGDISQRVIYDDSGDDNYRADLWRSYPDWDHVNAGPRQGFGGAIRAVWAYLRKHSTCRWVAHFEGDFTFPGPVNLDEMVELLDRQPRLAQVALLRQPWNDQERAAGGIIEQHPDDYQQVTDSQATWVEHRRFFTTNPTVYRRSLLTVGWPDGPNSEGMFTHKLLAVGTPETPGDEIRFAFWGGRDDPPRAHHIGTERAGTGY